MQYEPNYWIKPTGELVECPEHNAFAQRLLIEEMGLEGMEDECENLGVNYPYQILHKRGWVRVKNWSNLEILGDTVDLTRARSNTIDPPMNAAQMKAAKRLCDEYGESLHNAINAQRFRE